MLVLLVPSSFKHQDLRNRGGRTDEITHVSRMLNCSGHPEQPDHPFYLNLSIRIGLFVFVLYLFAFKGERKKE